MNIKGKFFYQILLVFIILLAVLKTGCSTSGRKPFLSPLKPGIGLSEIVNPKQLPDFNDDYSKESLLSSIDNSIKYFNRAKTYPFLFDSTGFTNEQQIDTLEFFSDGLSRYGDKEALNEFILQNFRVFQATGNMYRGEVHFTGYATPIYDGSLFKTDTFLYPLYKKPDNFHKPYYTRSEIESGNLLKGYEIVYLKSKLDAYLIHVQGSGQIRLPSGEKVYVGYGADSGHEYTSIGRLLVMDDKIHKDELTLSTLINYFVENPDDLDYYLKKNDRFIFFKKVDHAVPHGSIGVPVTPMRSIATDKLVMPPGGLAFLVIETKRSKFISWFKRKGKVKQSFFVLDQDTGSAIKTPARADVYFGIGDTAMIEAGNLNTHGRLYYLLKR